MLINTVMGSITSSVGNLVHSEGTTTEAKSIFFKKYQFIAFSLIYFASMGYLFFIHPFIIIWLGDDFSFSRWIEIVIVINFFLTSYRQPNLTLISIYGLSYEQNKKVIAEILLNIILSLYCLIVLDLGVAGILLGTIGSTLLTCTWYEPYSAFKYGIKLSSKDYFMTMLKHFTIFASSVACAVLLDIFVFSKQIFITSIIMKIILYLGMVSIYMYIYRNHEVSKLILYMIRRIIFFNRLRRK